MKLPSLPGIGDYLSAHRQAVLIIASAVELLILLILFLRWFDRRFGLRGTVRRIGRGIAGMARDLVGPIVKAVRLRRRARIIAVRIAAADPWSTARDALGSASAALAGHDEHWPYLAFIGAGTVTVTIAGPEALPPPEAELSTWRAKNGRNWTAPLPLPPAEDRPEFPLPIAVGILGDELVLVDLARSPGIVSVHGAPAPVDQLVSAMTAQLATAVAGGTVDRLLITEQVLPGAEVTPLPEALAALQARPAGGVAARAVLVCDHPDAAAAARIAVLAARDPGLLVLVAGYLPGSRWRLRVTTAGQVSATELSLEADSRPLWRGMELAGQARAAADPDRPIGPITPPPPRRTKPARFKPAATPARVVATSGATAAAPAPGLPDWADEASTFRPAGAPARSHLTVPTPPSSSAVDSRPPQPEPPLVPPVLTPYEPPVEQSPWASGPGPIWREPAAPTGAGPGPLWHEPARPPERGPAEQATADLTRPHSGDSESTAAEAVATQRAAAAGFAADSASGVWSPAVDDDLIEPTTTPQRPMARSGAEGDTAPTRSGD